MGKAILGSVALAIFAGLVGFGVGWHYSAKNELHSMPWNKSYIEDLDACYSWQLLTISRYIKDLADNPSKENTYRLAESISSGVHDSSEPAAGCKTLGSALDVYGENITSK